MKSIRMILAIMVSCSMLAYGIAGRAQTLDSEYDYINLTFALADCTSADEIFDFMSTMMLAYDHCEITLAERDDLLKMISDRLESFGYHEMSYEEIKCKNDDMSNVPDNSIMAVVPSTTSNVKFYSNRLKEAKSGVKYEVQVIRAVPISTNTPLYKTIVGAEIKKRFNNAIEAGALQAIKTTASAAAGATKTGLVALSFYDIAKASYSGLTKTTIINNVESSYTYSTSTQVVFRYVKKVGEGDNKQKLCHVSTSCTGYATITIPATIDTPAGITPYHISKQYDFRITPNGHENNDLALNYYLGKTTKYKYYVNYVNIGGLNGASIGKVFLETPEFPSQVQ